MFENKVAAEESFGSKVEEVLKLGSFGRRSKAGRVQLFSLRSMVKGFLASIWLIMLIGAWGGVNARGDIVVLSDCTYC